MREPRRPRWQGAKITPLHSRLGNRVRHGLKKKKKKKERKKQKNREKKRKKIYNYI